MTIGLILFLIMLVNSLAFSRLHQLGSPKISNFRRTIIRKLQLTHDSTLPKDKKNFWKNFINKPFYITTPIYYVNGDPHLGHAYTSVVCDVLARYQRLFQRDVHFLSGTDEHGAKVSKSARDNNMNEIEFTDKNSQKFRDLLEKFNCSNDDFIRTTESRHKEAVAAFWKLLEDNGDIYLGKYNGWYSLRDETFYNTDELVEGKAPTGSPVEWVDDECYFFKLSKYTETLIKLIEDNPEFIQPRAARNEMIGFLTQENGLNDISVSRSRFDWGIKVPGSPDHVVYVWLDALINYISALGFPDRQSLKFQKYWPASLHMVGKDIIRFHAIIWPALLLSAKLPLPERVFAHGWWTREGEKMSKSLGNVIDPLDLLKLYPRDYIRYYLVSDLVLGNNGDFTDSHFIMRVNGELANDYGNMVNRVATLIYKQKDSKVRSIPFDQLDQSNRELILIIRDGLDDLFEQLHKENLKSMCEINSSFLKLCNQYINIKEPWNLIKQGRNEELNEILYTLTEAIRMLTIYMEPIIPESAEKVYQILNISPEYRSLESISIPLPDRSINKPFIVFPRIEVKK